MYSEENNKKINYYLKLSGIILISFVAIFTLILSGSLSRYLASNSTTKTITVTGYAKMDVVPDIRTVSVNIIGKGKTEKEAQTNASTKSKSVSDALKAKNISDKDIKSQNLSTYPEYKTDTACPQSEINYRPCVTNSVISGYNTTQTIEVTLRGDSMKNTGDLFAGLTADGVTVQTGEATIENPEKLKTDIRSQAILDARKNADKLADSLGVRLGDVQSFNENSDGYPGSPMMMKDSFNTESVGAAAPSPVISDGSQKVTSTVSVTFEIR